MPILSHPKVVTNVKKQLVLGPDFWSPYQCQESNISTVGSYNKYQSVACFFCLAQQDRVSAYSKTAEP